MRSVPTGADPARLLRAMQADAEAGLVPTYVCATIGTTSSNAVDPVGAVADAAAWFGVWPVGARRRRIRRPRDGVESVSVSPHKWLLACLDRTCLWVRHARRLTDACGAEQTECQRNGGIESGVVRTPQGHTCRSAWGAASGQAHQRRRQAAEHIRSDVAVGKMFEDHAGARGRPVRGRGAEKLCARSGPARRRRRNACREENRELMERLNRSGKAFLTQTVVGDKFVLAVRGGVLVAGEARADRLAWEPIKTTAPEIMGTKAQAQEMMKQKTSSKRIKI
ncbi:hypothetical protein EJB05_39053, partial [Eragrostis curvula]